MAGRDPITPPCVICGGVIPFKPYGCITRRTCSPRCRTESRRRNLLENLRGSTVGATKRVHPPCVVCGKERGITDLAFLSQTCSPECNRAYRRRPLAERFWSSVKRGDGCWEWQAAIAKNGYGVLHASRVKGQEGRRYLLAHRVSWEIAFGRIPDNLCVLHRCDNRKCVRPDHLFVGTKGDNARDCVLKGRHSRRKLTRHDVVEIRSLAAGGVPYREIATRFGVRSDHIGKIVLRLAWKAQP